MEQTDGEYDYVPIEWTKEGRKHDRNRLLCTSFVVGALALYASSFPVKKHYVSFPKGSIVRQLSATERQQGAIASAEVPNESVNQIDCGGRDSLLFRQNNLENGIIIMRDKLGSTVIDCAEHGSPLDRSDHLRFN
jgi:beta-lactamase superfamily II metal-dependent hydrolase